MRPDGAGNAYLQEALRFIGIKILRLVPIKPTGPVEPIRGLGAVDAGCRSLRRHSEGAYDEPMAQ